jgi:hypothetical protein
MRQDLEVVHVENYKKGFVHHFQTEGDYKYPKIYFTSSIMETD